MMTEPTPHFDAVLEKYPGLFDREDEWVALVADPEHELVPVPEPSFSELLDQLTAKLPRDVVETTAVIVSAEATFRRIEIETEEDGDGGDDEDRPDGAAGGADPAGAAVVARDDGEGDVGEEGGGEAALGRDPGPAPGAAREG